MTRVLQITSKLFRGGAESFIMNVYRNLDRSNFKFDFLVLHSGREFYEDEIEDLGGHVYHVPIMEGVNIFRRRSMFDAFFAEHGTYDVVHCHMAALGADCLASAERSNVPIRLSHSHIADHEHTPRGYLKWLFERGFGNHATTRLACSMLAGQYMYGDASFTVINNGIESSRFAYDSVLRKVFRTSINADEDELLLGHAGRFHIQKNHRLLINVFAEMVGMGFPGRLVLAGEGPLQSEIEKHVFDTGLTDRVVFLGAIEDMAMFYSGIDLFIMPSLFEGLPFTAIEAQCSGLPCVFSDAISSECKITENVSFLPLDSGPEVWAESIMEICLSCMGETRLEGLDIIREAGYDILDVVAFLQSIYEGRR